MENNNITALIDYIYGNLTQKEKEAFEEKLKSDPELKNELDGLLAARKGLASLGDQEVMDPFVFQAGLNNSKWNKSMNRPGALALKYVIAIAASITILFFIGYLTKASLQFNPGSVTLSFGNNSTGEKPLTRDEVAGLIQNQISQNNKSLVGEIKSSQISLEKLADEHYKTEAAEMRKLFATYTQAKSDEIELALTRMKKDNRELVNEYVQQASGEQKLYVQNIVANFSDYLQKQRSDDLDKIRTSLVTLKQSQDVQKLQTSQILTSIISSLNSQNN